MATRCRAVGHLRRDEGGLVLVEYLILVGMFTGLIGVAYAVMEGNARAATDVSESVLTAE